MTKKRIMKEWILENQHIPASSDHRSVEQFAMDNCKMLVDAAADQRGQIYTCKTCNKEFSSFQALGGHRASHKRLPRIIVASSDGKNDEKVHMVSTSTFRSRRMHKCNVCGLEFSVGQALGGHMRRHRLGDRRSDSGTARSDCSSETTSDTNSNRFMLDLNLTPDENNLADCKAAASFLVNKFV